MDELRITDKNGVKYVFRGELTYKIVDGKEVLVKNEPDQKNTSDRSGK